MSIKIRCSDGAVMILDLKIAQMCPALDYLTKQQSSGAEERATHSDPRQAAQQDETTAKQAEKEKDDTTAEQAEKEKDDTTAKQAEKEKEEAGAPGNIKRRKMEDAEEQRMECEEAQEGAERGETSGAAGEPQRGDDVEQSGGEERGGRGEEKKPSESEELGAVSGNREVPVAGSIPGADENLSGQERQQPPPTKELASLAVSGSQVQEDVKQGEREGRGEAGEEKMEEEEEEEEEEVANVDVSQPIMEWVVRWCQHHALDPPDVLPVANKKSVELSAWDDTFVRYVGQKGKGVFFEVLQAADTLDIELLKDCLCKHIADNINNATPPDIKDFFTVKEPGQPL